MKTKSKMALFDVCGTITKTNNTFDFIGFILKENKLRHFLFRMICLISFLINFFKIQILLKKDITRSWFISLLRDYRVKDIEEKGKEYVDILYKKNLINKNIIYLIEKEKLIKQEVILISASIDPPIREIAKRLGTKRFFSSELEIINGKYTGKLKSDLLGKKESILRSKLKNIDLVNSSFYSDNEEDMPLMKIISNSSVVVNSSNNKKFWEKSLRENELRASLIINYRHKIKKHSSREDVDSINQKTVPFVYIPTFYYILSRLHFRGLIIELFLKNVLPISVFIYLFSSEITSLVGSFILTSLSFFAFFSFYEIGGLANDFHALKNKDGTTPRIKPGTKISFSLFLLIRLVALGFIFLYLSSQNYGLILYVSLMILCLFSYFLHTVVGKNLKLFTFTLLKIFRTLIPLVVFIKFVSIVDLFIVLFINNVPESIYFHMSKKYGFRGMSIGKIVYVKMILLIFGFIVYMFTGKIIYLLFPIYFLLLVILLAMAKIFFEDKFA